MPLTPFEREVLAWVFEDYEAIHTIRGDIARDLGRSVSEEEVGAALLTLARAGYVDAFLCDSSGFESADVDKHPLAELWFLGNEAGLAEDERG